MSNQVIDLTRRELLFGLAASTLYAAPASTKVVLVAGTQSHKPGDHEYNAGCYLLASFIKQNGVAEPVVVTGGWPEDEAIFNGANAIVLYMDGGPAHPILKDQRLQTIDKLMQKGVGLACLHYAVEVPKDAAGAQFLDWIGGFYEKSYSLNPWNGAELVRASPDHPISRGWESFHLADEWYFRIRFNENDKRVSPILTSMLPPNAPNREVTAWATERADGGRGFGFTGLHRHRNWSDSNFRRLLVNAVLWTAKCDIPSSGAKCELDPRDLDKNLFPVKSA